MPCKFRRKSSESNVASQAVHFNPQTSEVVLPEPCVEPKLSHRTTKSLYISRTVSIFYGTEIEIWAGFGMVLGRLAVLKKKFRAIIFFMFS